MLIFAENSRKVLGHSERVRRILGTTAQSELRRFCELVLSSRRGVNSVVYVDWLRSRKDILRVAARLKKGRFGSEKVYFVSLCEAGEAHHVRSKSIYLAAIGHEIRTPMHGIIGNLELLSESALAVSQRRCVDSIRRSLDALQDLANNMLDVARADLDMLPLTSYDVDVRALVCQGVRSISAAILGKGLALSCTVDPEADSTWCIDGYRFVHIMQNLLSNALKFTERGGIGIHLSCAGSPQMGPSAMKLLMEVRDTGGGIPSNAWKLSGQFGALSVGSQMRAGGGGIGLYLCHMFARQMGGGLEMFSEPGVGSVMRVTLPARRSSKNNKVHDGKLMEGITVCVRQTEAWGTGNLIRRLQAYGAHVVLNGAKTHDLSIELHDDAKKVPLRSASPGQLLFLSPSGPEQAQYKGKGVWELNSNDVQALDEFLNNFCAANNAHRQAGYIKKVQSVLRRGNNATLPMIRDEAV